MNGSATRATAKEGRPRILFVDDEPLVLEGLRRSLPREFDTYFANSGEDGLCRIRAENPYAVVISDMRMPGMDGAEFLAQVRSVSPDSIRVLLTGYSDVEAAMRAVNEGRIFRFLNKPTSSEQLSNTLRDCTAQFHLVRAEKELLENTLAGTVRVLTEVLNLANPAAFNKGARIREYVRHIVKKLCLDGGWQYELAAMLSEIGCVTLAPDLLEAVHAGQPLKPEDQQRYGMHPKIGYDLLVHIPRLEPVANMILKQDESPGQIENALAPDDQIVRNGAQMLKVGLAFDRLLSTGCGKSEAIAILAKSPEQYYSKFVWVLEDFHLARAATDVRLVDGRDLFTGMVLNQDLRTTSGMLLAAKDQEVTYALVRTVRNYTENGHLSGKIRVSVSS